MKINVLKEKYEFAPKRGIIPGDVESFLTEHPSLYHTLIKAPEQVHRFFPKEKVKLRLENCIDPEEGYAILFLKIRAHQNDIPPDKAIELLGKLDEWYLGLPTDVRRVFNTTIEYAPEQEKIA